MKRINLILLFTWFFILLIVILSPHRVHAQACLPVTAGPNLYQIDRANTKATLYFTPINTQIVSYTIEYGLKEGESSYSITFGSGSSTGAISYTVNELDSSFQYYFRVRSNTTCTNSPWSAWVGDKHTPAVQTQVQGVSGAVPAPGSELIWIVAVLGIGSIIGGTYLIRSSF